MPKIKPVYKTDFYSYVFKNIKNINISNTELIDTAWKILSDNDRFEYISEHKINVYFHNIFFNRAKTNKKYWLTRGWSEKEAELQSIKEQEKNILKPISKITFRKRLNEIFNNTFNLNNNEYLEYLQKSVFDNCDCIGEQKFISKIRKLVNKDKPKNIKGWSEIDINFWISRGWSKEEAKNIVSTKQRERSKRSIDYYIKRGYSPKDALLEVSKYQQEIAGYSKSTTEYWRKKGFDDITAEKIANKISADRSVWGKKYWMLQGYDEIDAQEKALEYNAMSVKCKKFENDINKFYEFKKYVSSKHKERIKTNIHKDPLNYVAKLSQGIIKQCSKEEAYAFDILKQIDNRILHKPYYIIIPEDFDAINTYFFVCDGYIEEDDNIIIIEYDGKIFHDKETDKIRDYQIMNIDQKILGVIRIEDSFLKNGYTENKKQLIKDAIYKIENTEESRIYIS